MDIKVRLVKIAFTLSNVVLNFILKELYHAHTLTYTRLLLFKITFNDHLFIIFLTQIKPVEIVVAFLLLGNGFH